MAHTDTTENTEEEPNAALLLEVFKTTGTTDTTVGRNLLFYSTFDRITSGEVPIRVVAEIL